VPDQPFRAAFPTTRITLIEAACGRPSSETREALSTLCSVYWYPIYAYIRRLGYAQEDAEDLTQAFFARVVEKQYLRDFEQQRGRFRSFLLAAVKHFVANERDWSRAQKRGGASIVLPLDAVLRSAERRYSLEPRHDLSPEKLFERQWALALLTRVQERLQGEAERDGKAAQFERLKSRLVGDDVSEGYRTIALELNTTEGAIKVVVHRLRHRFRELLREEISQTVDDPEEVGHELRELLVAIGS
jgi:DNA-directed RNA polymerase specialized sigma24 family protein